MCQKPAGNTCGTISVPTCTNSLCASLGWAYNGYCPVCQPCGSVGSLSSYQDECNVFDSISTCCQGNCSPQWTLLGNYAS